MPISEWRADFQGHQWDRRLLVALQNDVENVPSRTAIPRGFGIDPSGRFLIVGGQKSDDAAVFRIDQETGRLKATGQKVKVGAPVCVEFVPR